MGQGGGREGCMMRIGEGAARIGQGGGCNLVVGLAEGYLLLWWLVLVPIPFWFFDRPGWWAGSGNPVWIGGELVSVCRFTNGGW